jgi:hypothetical protein
MKISILALHTTITLYEVMYALRELGSSKTGDEPPGLQLSVWKLAITSIKIWLL